MSEFTLKCFVESGNAYKTALMLELCGADWTPVWVDFFNGETRSDGFRAENTMGEVPVLIHHRDGQDDLVLTQTGVILTYLSRHFGEFGPENDQEEYEILRWILFDNHKLTANTATARFMSLFMKKPDAPETQFLHARALGAYKVFDQHMNGRDWAAADRPTIADLSLCGYLFWPDQINVSWDDYPNIKRWLSNIQSLEGWKRPEDILPATPTE
ncbi:MAG: glutathione S-transferase family protein [Pseudomonadota bacterium]